MKKENSKNAFPPFIARWLLELILAVEHSSVIGDLEQEFHEERAANGVVRAKVNYWLQTLRIAPLVICHNIIWSLIMLKNYVRVALRNLLKHRAFSFINISGLAIGMTCSVLILLYVQDELSYDKFHEQADNIYRVERKGTFDGRPFHVPVTANPYAEALISEYAEVVEAVRFWPVSFSVLDSQNQFYDEEMIFTDRSLFEVFSFELLQGNEKTALEEPNSIVLTKRMTQKYIPDGNPLGQIIRMQWSGQEVQFKVTGIMADIPANSHIKTDFFLSYSSLDNLLPPQNLQSWGFNGVYTYVVLRDGVAAESLEKKLPQFLEKYLAPVFRSILTGDVNINDIIQLKLRNVAAIHLYSNLQFEMNPGGSIITVYTLTAVALLILVIACINFMNLSTARSASRATEIGMRKVIGAYRSRIVQQFLSESAIHALLALVICGFLVELLLPTLNQLTGKELDINYFSNYDYLFALIGLATIVGLISGAYPAVLLSAFNPATVLKGKTATGKGAIFLRKGLVILQFSASIALIIGTLIIVEQLEYFKNKKLGFDKEHVVVLPTRDPEIRSKVQTLRAELIKNAEIKNVSLSSRVPGNRQFNDVGFFERSGEVTMEDVVTMFIFVIDEEFLPTIGAELAAGRNFSQNFSTDVQQSLILNEAAVVDLGWENAENAIGRKLYLPIGINPPQFAEYNIIGVVKDFHFKSLHHKIEPLVLTMNPSGFHPHSTQFLSVTIQSANISGLMDSIRNKMAEFSPRFPFEFYFLDAYFDRLYESEQQLQAILGYLTFLAIFVACLGLFGLAAFSIEQRTKEIGVRKVVGASMVQIFILLSRDFLKLVLIAFVIACPLAYFAMNKWLENFAYRSELSADVFVFAGILTFAVACLTVSYQSIKSGLTNPVDALRYE